MVIASTTQAILPILLATGAVVALGIGGWFVKFPRLALLLLFASLITGQVVRYALPGQGGGLLLSDVAAAVLLGAIGVRVLRGGNKKVARARYALFLFIPFMLWSLVGLVIYYPSLGLGGVLVALSYWVRLSVYVLLLPGLVWLFSQKQGWRDFATKGLMATVLIIAVLGFVQLRLVPDLSVLVGRGWDPHNMRLVSTWMDPNLIAGLFVVTLPFMASLVLVKKSHFLLTFSVIALPLLAFLLTQSRSGLAAFAGTVVLIIPLWLVKWLRGASRAKLVFLGNILGLFTIIFLIGVFMLGDRAIGLVRGDATVQIRAEALAVAWSLAEQNYIFGVGYNAYQFAALEAGLIGDFTIHSRGGADNSWLTLWVTTGIAGTVLWLVPWIFFIHYFVKRWLQEGHYLSLAAIAGFTALFIHSQFVNSFLYGHLLIVLIVVFALSASDKSAMIKT